MSAFSHLIAAGFALAAAVPLVRLGRGCSTRVVALSIYVSSVVAALAISGAYHSCDRGGAARAVMQRLDHYAIWALIAGNFTAVYGVMNRASLRNNRFLFLIWGYAATGVLLQIFWFDIFKGTAGLALYLAFGWLGFAPIVRLGRQLGFVAVLPILYAGIAFSAGAILEKIGWPVLISGWFGAHEFFHFAVVFGIGMLWLFIRKLLLHHLPTPTSAPATP